MIYTVNRYSNGNMVYSGGFADRLKGLVSCYWLSVLLDDFLCVDWKQPVPIEKCFVFKNKINISISPFDLSCPENYLDLTDQGYHKYLQGIKEQLLLCESENDFKQLFSSLRFSAISSNALFEFLFNNKSIRSILYQKTGHDFKINSELFRVFFNENILINQSNKFLIDRLRDMSLWADECDIIGLHVRLGGSHVSWNDPVVDDYETTYSKLASLCENGWFDKRKVFFCTDSQVFKKNVIDNLFKKFNIAYYVHESIIAHAERSSLNLGDELSAFSNDSLTTTVLDFESLRKCSTIIHGNGGFSRVAGYSSGANLIYLHALNI